MPDCRYRRRFFCHCHAIIYNTQPKKVHRGANGESHGRHCDHVRLVWSLKGRGAGFSFGWAN